jgi:hypothetical protein
MKVYKSILRDRDQWDIGDLRDDPPTERGWAVSRRRSIFGD